MSKEDKDDLRRFQANEKTLADLAKREGALASGLIELQQQDTPDDAVAEDLLSAPGPYSKALANLVSRYGQISGDVDYVGLDKLGPGRGKYLWATRQMSNGERGYEEPRRYNDPELLAIMRKLLKATRMGGVSVMGGKNPTVSFSPMLRGKWDDGKFHVVPFAEREALNKTYGIRNGSTIVATDVNGLYVRDTEGAIKLVKPGKNNKMRKQAAVDSPLLPAVLLGAALTPLAIYGVGKYKDRKATAATDDPEFRVPVKEALGMARKLKPGNTHIATNAKQLRQLADRYGGITDDPDQYWMQAILEEGQDGKPKYAGAVVNAPADAAGTVNYPALLHEIGHAIDYQNGRAEIDAKTGILRRLGDQFIGLVAPSKTRLGSKELQAWVNSGIQEDNRVRRTALATYNWHLRTKLLNTLASILSYDPEGVAAGLAED